MKKGVLGTALMISLVLAGCSQSLSSEEVVNEVSANQENVENYHAVIDLGISGTDQASGEVFQDTLTNMDVVINEDTMDTYGKITVEDVAFDAIQEYYAVGEEAYVKMNEGVWQDVSNQKETLFENDQTLYPNLVPIVEAISTAGEMTEEDNAYVYTFQGTNDELYAAFETPYSISFGTVPTNQVEQNARVSINKDTLLIEEISNQLTGALQGQELVITIHQVYENMNEMNDISIPQEVVDAAQ